MNCIGEESVRHYDGDYLDPYLFHLTPVSPPYRPRFWSRSSLPIPGSRGSDPVRGAREDTYGDNDYIIQKRNQ